MLQLFTDLLLCGSHGRRATGAGARGRVSPPCNVVVIAVESTEVHHPRRSLQALALRQYPFKLHLHLHWQTDAPSPRHTPAFKQQLCFEAHNGCLKSAGLHRGASLCKLV